MSAREEFWDLVCSNAPFFYVGLAFVTVMAALNLAAVVLADQSEGTFAVSLLVFVILGITALGLVAVLWRCDRR